MTNTRTLAIAVAAIALASLALVMYPFRPAGTVVLRLATTTSVSDSGLLDFLKTQFEEDNPDINLTWVSVGTGQAIEIGKRGDADAVLVHSRDLEDQFIADGYGVHGVTIAYNDYVVVGPDEDPAILSLVSSVVEAFSRVYETGASGKAKFVSRSDKSGTYTKEIGIWSKANLNVTKQAWYIESGLGMAQALRMADNLRGYTLSDRGTYLSLAGELKLKIVFEGDPLMLNPYRVIIVNPDKFPKTNYEAAERFVLFLVSPKGQELIGNYTKGGQRLFNPAFGNLTRLGMEDPLEEQQVAYWTQKLNG